MKSILEKDSCPRLITEWDLADGEYEKYQELKDETLSQGDEEEKEDE